MSREPVAFGVAPPDSGPSGRCRISCRVGVASERGTCRATCRDDVAPAIDRRRDRHTASLDAVVSRPSPRPSACRRGYNRRWRSLAQAAIQRHPWCEDCGSRDDLTGDHRIPVSMGGMNVPGNVAVRCRSCNARKGNRPEARTQLRLDLLAPNHKVTS